MGRAIIRFSMDNDRSHVTGNLVRKELTDAGFEKIGTASFEADDLPQDQIFDALNKAVKILRDAPGGGTLDHLWIYVDQLPDPN